MGASYQNWSWSFINEKEKIIIFGELDIHTSAEQAVIFSEDWIKNDRDRKPPGYEQSKAYIRRIVEEGYQLKIFPVQSISSDSTDDGRAKIKSFTPVFTVKF